MTMRSFSKVAWMVGAGLVLTACNSTSVRVGGAPDEHQELRGGGLA